jgi:SAM-dependent methyltransferase
VASSSERDEQRWASESEFFDARVYSLERLDSRVIERYRKCSHPYLPSEYPFWCLGDVTGKRILDIGCGDGTNALLLALKGAYVTGIDLSSAAIGAARQRALLHGLEDRTEFVQGPIEITLAGQGRFDIITGFAILHHLLPVLHSFLFQAKQYGTGRTRFVFVEPVSLSAFFRKLRKALPLSLCGTAEERPLERAEINLVLRQFRAAEIRYFHIAGRAVARFLLGNGSYEQASPWRRLAYRLGCRSDRILIDRLGLEGLAAVAVFICDE